MFISREILSVKNLCFRTLAGVKPAPIHNCQCNETEKGVYIRLWHTKQFWLTLLQNQLRNPEGHRR